MRLAGALMLLFGLLICGFEIAAYVISNYTFERDYLNLWNLADKSSTIPAKEQYIEKFVSALESGRSQDYLAGQFSSHDAMFLKTADNSFEANLAAVRTLSGRLKEIQNMNPSSFEYNTAIQQITAQEQGESRAMLSVFKGCYDLKNYPFAWGWVSDVLWIVSVISMSAGFCLLIAQLDSYFNG